MRNVNNQSQQITLGEIRIKVFQIGDTLKIKKGVLPAQHPDALKAIHSHFTYEMLFVTEGTLHLITEDAVRTYEDAVLIIPPHLKHVSYPESDACFCLLFSFETLHITGTLIQRMEQEVVAFPITEEMRFYIRTAAQKKEKHTEASDRELQYLTALLFSAVLDAVAPEKTLESISSESNREHIEAIETYIHKNLHRKFSLADVSEKVFLSTRQISRIIERAYGIGFSELVLEKRLATSEMLLKNTDQKITAIAAETFPGAESYFYTLFKKKYGMSPLQYRKESRAKNE